MKPRAYSPLHEQLWLEGLKELDGFRAIHGHSRVPTSWIAANGHRTGAWLVRVRAQQRAGQLGAARLEQLREREVNPNRSEDVFQDWLSILDEYANIHFDTNVPLNFVDTRGNKLGPWLSRQRRQMRAGVLEENRQQMLLERGVDLDPQDTAFQNALVEVDLWGEINVPQKTVTNSGFHLGMWVSAQRHRHRLGLLSARRVRELEGRGLVWEVREESFQAGLKELDWHLSFAHNDSLHSGMVTASGFPLGNWLQARQAQHKKGALPREHLRELSDREIHWAR